MRVLLHLVAVVLGVGFLSYPSVAVQGQARPDFISGAVRSEQGPEAGVWVIAETKDLQTKFIKIVVTDDQGRFVLPELPNANYSVWVRGYGLVDSTQVTTETRRHRGRRSQRTLAKTPQEAAKVYPGNYWLSLMAPPANSVVSRHRQRRQRLRSDDADARTTGSTRSSRAATSVISSETS